MSLRYSWYLLGAALAITTAIQVTTQIRRLGLRCRQPGLRTWSFHVVVFRGQLQNVQRYSHCFAYALCPVTVLSRHHRGLLKYPTNQSSKIFVLTNWENLNLGKHQLKWTLNVFFSIKLWLSTTKTAERAEHITPFDFWYLIRKRHVMNMLVLHLTWSSFVSGKRKTLCKTNAEISNRSSPE